MDESSEIDENELTPEEQAELASAISSRGYPLDAEQKGLLGFFTKILGTGDSSKVSFLEPNELDAVRIYQSTSLYARKMGLDRVAKYLEIEGEIVLRTSSSKGGFLVNAAITQKKTLESATKMQTGGKSKWPKRD